MVADIKDQEEFNRRFEVSLNKMSISWKLIKDVIIKYPEFYDEYARTHDFKLNIKRRSMCDGCKWNDGTPHGACWSRAD